MKGEMAALTAINRCTRAVLTFSMVLGGPRQGAAPKYIGSGRVQIERERRERVTTLGPNTVRLVERKKIVRSCNREPLRLKLITTVGALAQQAGAGGRRAVEQQAGIC